MRSSTFRRAAIAAGLGCLAAGAAVPVTMVGCTETAAPDRASAAAPADPEDVSSLSSEAGNAALRAVRARFASVIDVGRHEPPLARLSRSTSGGSGGIQAERAGDAAVVELPLAANDAVRVADEASGVAVSFALEGAKPTPIAIADGFAVYPAAAPSGGDVVHRVTANGTEDFVFFEKSPEDERLRYHVDVRHVSGLRIVDRTLELLDGHGAPRLRVAPPEVVDAPGRHGRADRALEGCAADRSPRAPWGRPVTKPGAAECTVVVAWADRGVAYPAIVDPAWVLTKNMVVERAQHAVAMLPNPVAAPNDASPVLITGGFDKNDAPLASAEVYEPLSRTFAATGSMIKVRAAHTATVIPTSQIGQVVVTGGAASIVNKTPPEQLAFASLADGATTEIYNPQTGLFTLGPNMGSPRYRHTAIAIPDGRILIVGGIADLVNQPTKFADLFSFDPISPPGTIAPTGQLVSARSAHAAALFNGTVLITGGIGSSSFALLTGEIFTPAQGTFAQAPGLMTAARAFHTATTLSTGDVLIAGGVNAQSAPIGYSSTADVYAAGGFALQAITMSAPRAFHTATRLVPTSLLVVPNPAPPTTAAAEVIFAGGFDGLADLATTEAYFPATKEILSFATTMQRTRRHAASALVNAGGNAAAGRAAVVIGGVNGSTTAGSVLTNGQSTRTAEVLAKSLGEACAAAAECLSGFCADGVCCNKGCTEECFSCAAPLKQDQAASGTCGPTLAGTQLPIKCLTNGATNEHVEVHNECDGLGAAQPGPLTKSCKPATCNATGTACIAVCSPTLGCAANGWCDFGSPPDGGVDPDAGAGAGPYGSCADKKDPALPCAAGVECKSRFCIDGVCCNSACQEQCVACNLPGFVGTCTQVGNVEPLGQPHDNDAGDINNEVGPDAGASVPRVACAGFGTACGGGCGSTSVGSCEYPDAGSQLTDPACTDQPSGPSTLVRFLCDSAGGSFDSPGDCGGFRCAAGATACKATCSRQGDAGDGDCIEDFICEDDGGTGSCVALTGPRCDGDKTIRYPVAQGGYQVCPNHYACPVGATACLTQCTSVADCVDGYVCDGNNKCVKPLSAPATLPSCSAGGVASDTRAPGVWAAAALGLLGLASRRRRRSRDR